MLSDIKKIFQSNIKSLEIFYLLENLKPAARIMVKEGDRDKIFTFFAENNICYCASDFKVVKQDAGKAYSDKGLRVPIGSREEGYFFVYASKQKELAERAKGLEEKNRHNELGIALGYPQCCADFFERHFEEESKKNNDFTLAALNSSDGFQFPFCINIAARHFDISLLSHFPCSFNCKESIELAKRNLALIEKHDNGLAESIRDMLKGAVLYTESMGVFLLRLPRLDNKILYYKEVMPSNKNQIHELLKNTGQIEIVDKNIIRLGNRDIKNVGMMLFY